jgi:AcrR family transcriptional regulator
VAERGYDGFTVDEVAARAGVGKAAIYRRYRSKAEMVFAATVHDLDAVPPGDAGSLTEDLLALALFIRENIERPVARQVAPALIAELARDPQLVLRFRQTFVAKQQSDFAALLDRAVRRGELARPADPALVHLLLSGPIFAALVAFHTPVDDQLLRDITTVIAAGLVAADGQPAAGTAPGPRGEPDRPTSEGAPR